MQGDLAQFYNEAAASFIPDEEICDALELAGQPEPEDILLGLKAAYYINQGLFVPDKITNALFEAAFRSMDFRNAVLDGYPRTADQARFLLPTLVAGNFPGDYGMRVVTQCGAQILVGLVLFGVLRPSASLHLLRRSLSGDLPGLQPARQGGHVLRRP